MTQEDYERAIKVLPCEDKMYFEYMRGFDKGRESVKPCEDVVSRQAVLDTLYENGYPMMDKPSKMVHAIPYQDALSLIEQLPPVRPQEPKTGHWDKSCICSECGEWRILETEKISGKYKFCPNCGVKMESEEE